MKIPCEECITFPICIHQKRYKNIIVHAQCPILEEFIDKECMRKQCQGDVEVIIDIEEWYTKKTGHKL